VELLKVDLAFAQAIVEAAEGVFEGDYGAERVFADGGVVGLLAMNRDRGASFRAVERNRQAANFADGLGRLKRFQSSGEEGKSTACFGAVGEIFFLHRHCEIARL
jgi:hypothetical protein